MKNIKRLFVVLVTLVLAVYGVINFKEVTGSIRLGRDIADAYQTKMTLPSVDEKMRLQDQATLEARLRHFGLDDAVVTTQDDMLVSVEYSANADISYIEDVITAKGDVSIRDGKDNVLASGRDLFSSVSVVRQKDATFLTFKVKDKNLLASTTSLVAAQGSEGMMVVWLDFQEGQSYETESKKETPAFLAAASVPKAMKESQISLRTMHTGDKLDKEVSIVNGGAYSVNSISPVTFSISSVYGTNFANNIKLGVTIAAVLIALALIIKYRAAGLLASLSLGFMAFYTGLFFRTVDGIITFSTMIGFNIALFLGLVYIIGFIGVMKNEIASGRSGVNAYTTASKDNKKYLITVVAMMAGFSVIYLMSTGTIRSFATIMVLGGVSAFVFNIWYLRLCISMLLIDNAAEAAMFGVSKKDIPDVAKGEERIHETKLSKFDYASKFKTARIVAIVLAVVGVGLMGFKATSEGFIFSTAQEFGSGVELMVSGEDTSSIETVLNDSGLKYSTKQTGEVDGMPMTKYYFAKVSDEAFSTLESNLQGDVPAAAYRVNRGVATNFVKDSLVTVSLGLIAASLIVFITNKGKSLALVFVNACISVFLVLCLEAILPGLVDKSIVNVLLMTFMASYVLSVYVDNNAKDALRRNRGKKKLAKEDYTIAMNEGLQKSSALVVSTTLLLTVFGLITNGLTVKVYPFAWLIVCFTTLFVYGYLWVAVQSKVKEVDPKAKNKKKSKPKTKEVEEMIIPGMNDY